MKQNYYIYVCQAGATTASAALGRAHHPSAGKLLGTFSLFYLFEIASSSGLSCFHFQASLGLHLLFFNLTGALWLVAREGIPILITAYLIQVEEHSQVTLS